jgi:hypothetical protein
MGEGEGASPAKATRATLTREQLGIVDAAQDVFETADEPEATSLAPPVQRELADGLRSQRDERPALPAPIDRAPLEPGAARSFFQTLDAVSQQPPGADFSQEAHERKREEWRILGSRQRALETPFDRYTRLLAEAQALQRLPSPPAFPHGGARARMPCLHATFARRAPQQSQGPTGDQVLACPPPPLDA